MEVKTEMNRVLQKYLERNTLESTFEWCTEQVIIPEPASYGSLLEAIRALLSSNTEKWPLYIRDYTEYLLNQSNPHCVQLLTGVLETLVTNGNIPARLVCEVLLSQLNVKNLLTWQLSLSLIHRIIGGVDYKGCREVMKLLLDKFDGLPRSVPEEQVPALHAGRQVLAYILDRNASLMPSYIAHDEIQLRYTAADTHPHWALQDVIASLRGTMEVVAHLVSGNMLPHLVPVIGCSNTAGSAWKLDPAQSCFSLPGRLPYSQALLKPQTELLYRVLAQSQSKDAVISMLNLVKTPHIHSVLEKCIVQLIVDGIKATNEWETDSSCIQTWSHITNQFLLMSAMQVINPFAVLNDIKEKLKGLVPVMDGRGYFMWLILYFLSGIGSKEMTQGECNVICSIITLLYKDTVGEQPVIPPDLQSCKCVYQLAAAGVWIVTSKKIEGSAVSMPFEAPLALRKHLEFVQEQLEFLSSDAPPSCYMMTILLNTFCTNSDASNSILNVLLSSVHPLPIQCINLMVLQAKHKVADKIKYQLMKAADAIKQQQSQSDTNTTAPVTVELLETFSRLLLWVGTKQFQSQLIPVIFKLQDWSMLQNILELISYRIHTQLQMSSRFQILILLHSIAGVSIIPTQLFIGAENTALHLILGLTETEALPLQLIKSPTEPKALFHSDSDELNKTLILSLAQSLSLSRVDLGSWLENLLKELERSIFQWSETSLSFLPLPFRQLCHTPPAHESVRLALLSRVEEEYQKLSNKSESELQQHYTEGDANLYIFCVMWKQLLDTNQITPLVARLLQRLRLSPKKQASVLRTLMDYIVYTCPSPSSNNAEFMRVVSCLNNLIWRYFLYPLDRLLLCLIWRCYNRQYSVIAVTLIYHLLMSENIISRLDDFIDTVSDWKDISWSEKHTTYLNRNPECFTFDTSGTATVAPIMKVLFGNVCLRLLPIIDLTIQRMLEVPQSYQSFLNSLLEKYKYLYRFHKSPVNYLFRVLHYYSSTLIDCIQLKQNLVSSILGSLSTEQLSSEMRFSTLFKNCVIERTVTDIAVPDTEYWQTLLVQIKNALIPFNDSSVPHLSWPLSEFSNPSCCLLVSAAVEILTLPLPMQQVTQSFLNTLISVYTSKLLPFQESMDILNVGGALLSVLPDAYSAVFYDQICSLLLSIKTANGTAQNLMGEGTIAWCLLNLAHSFLHHSNISVITGLLSWLQTKAKPIITNEVQLLFICHLLAAVLSRLKSEKPTLLLQVVTELYHLIKQVDSAQNGVMNNCSPICDLLYHIKYMHIGDAKKDEIETIVVSLHTPLKLRLRFLVQPAVASGGVVSALTPVLSVVPTQELVH